MPAFKRPELVQAVTTPQHFTPPTARERRAEAVQRLQVGLFGLAAMLLLVGMANIIMERARLAEAAGGATSSVHVAASSAAGNTDPLADLGVIPSPAAVPAGRNGAGARSVAAH